MKKIRILQNTGLIVLDSNKRYDYMPKDVFIKMFLPQDCSYCIVPFMKLGKRRRHLLPNPPFVYNKPVRQYFASYSSSVLLQDLYRGRTAFHNSTSVQQLAHPKIIQHRWVLSFSLYTHTSIPGVRALPIL